MTRTLVILHPGGFGDLLLAAPAIHHLRQRFPGREILLCGEKHAAEFLRECGFVDREMSVQSTACTALFGGAAPEDPVLRDRLSCCDLAVAWTGDAAGTLAAALKACGAADVIVQSPFASTLVSVHQSDRFLEIVHGRPDHVWMAPLSLPEKRRLEAEAYLHRFGIAGDRPVAVIHPGSGSRYKCVKPEVLLPVFEGLEAREWEVLLLQGPADGEMVQGLLRRMSRPPIVLSGLSLPVLAGVLSQIDLFVGHDSGVTHLASLLGTPTVGLFGPTDPARWLPRGASVTVIQGRACQCHSWEAVKNCVQKPCLELSPQAILDACLAARKPSNFLTHALSPNSPLCYSDKLIFSFNAKDLRSLGAILSHGVVQEKVTNALLGALNGAREKGQLKTAAWPTLNLDAPKRPEWGDLASTVAMSLASSEQRAPHDIAQIIVENLPQREQLFDRVEIVRPGFLNLTVKPALWQETLKEIEAQGASYGTTNLGKGRRVLVEYVSANPTGPLHVGHGRGAAVGQAIASLLHAVGFEVVSEYYINDAGRQMKLLGASVVARYRELAGQPAAFPEDGYHGAYIATLAQHLKSKLDVVAGDSSEQLEEKCRTLAYQELLNLIREDLIAFGIEFDSWFSEASLLSSEAVEHVLEELKSRQLLFEQDGAWWFRTTAFGDEKDRVVKKQDGEYTYLASDIAYHRDKLQRGYELLIDVWGADHHGYIPRMQAVMQAYGHPKERLQVVLVQLVKLLRAGEEVKMSKRTGEFITMREVIDEVGADAAKFYFLMRDSKTHLEFDLELAKQRSADNPVYYVQYAHARIASLWRVAASRGIPCPLPSQTDLSLLSDPDELGLIRKLAAYPSVLEAAAIGYEPHRMTYYLQQLAALLHTFYNKHRILPPAADAEVFAQTAPGIAADEGARRETLAPERTAARLALMRGVQQVIKNGLTVLGISAPHQM